MSEAKTILLQDDRIWTPSATLLDTQSITQTGQFGIEIDLGLYKFISKLKIQNGNPGITKFTIWKKNLLGNLQSMVAETNLNDNQLLVQDISDVKPVRYLYLTVFVKLVRSTWSGLQFINFLTEEEDAEEFVLFKHKNSKKYLSVGPLDNLLYLHQYDCRTNQLIQWKCEQGQLRNNNGKYLKFMTRAEYDAITDKQGVETVSETEMVPTFREDATHESSIIEILDDKIAITIDSTQYFLHPQEFNKHSYMKTGQADDSCKFSISSPGTT